METIIKLIVGLGNPGPHYANNRHNVGSWFVEELAARSNHQLHLETKFHGLFATIKLAEHECKLLFPTTYMNRSGQAVRAIAHFYKIQPKEILVVHDELDFPAGTVKLKFDGGNAGHNGLEDISSHLNSREFYRLRLGIGRPSQKSVDIADYVTSDPSRADRLEIYTAIERAIKILPEILAGNIEKAMQELHSS